jgi:hypothetical protein
LSLTSELFLNSLQTLAVGKFGHVGMPETFRLRLTLPYGGSFPQNADTGCLFETLWRKSAESGHFSQSVSPEWPGSPNSW